MAGDINKKISLNIDVKNKQELDKLDKQLDKLQKQVDKLYRGTPEQRMEAAKLVETMSKLNEQFVKRQKLQEALNKVGRGESLTKEEKERLELAVKANRLEEQAQKRKLEYLDALNKKQAEAETKGARISWYLRHGYNIGQATHEAAKGTKSFEEAQTEYKKSLDTKYVAPKAPELFGRGTTVSDMLKRFGPSEWYGRLSKESAAKASDLMSQAKEAELAGDMKKAQALKAASGEASATAASMASKANSATFLITAISDTLKDTWKIVKSVHSTFKEITGLSLSIKDNFNSIFNTMGQMLSKTGIASYSTGTSLITNAAARTTQLRYGITAGQTYALTQTMGMLGMGSEEDLMWMNPSQREVFSQYMQKYSAWYDKLSSSGVLDTIQQLQLDFEMFRQEMAVDLLNWVAENKDTIMTVLKGLLTFTKAIVQMLGKVFTLFGVNYSDNSFGTTSDLTNGAYASTSKTTIINIKSTANATGVLSDQRAFEEFFSTQMKEQLRAASAEMGE